MRTRHDDPVIEWLLAGDSAIRWQVMRDLLDEPTETWEAERRRAAESGWIAELLERRGPDGEWPPGRWTASTWTLLLLVACGIPEGHPAGRAPVERLLDRFMPPGDEVDQAFLLKRLDLCHLGFWAGLGAHFLGDDPRLAPLGEAVLSAQFEDGGWNCHMRNYPQRRHSSFHTTFNVLENLRIASERGAVPKQAFRAAEARAVEFMLAHRLYPLRPDRRGHLGALHTADVSMALALHGAARSRLHPPDLRDLRPAAHGRDRPLAGEAQAERAVATPEAHPRDAAGRDGEARPGQPMEHAAGASCPAPPRHRLGTGQRQASSA